MNRDLSWFVEWRPWLWTPVLRDALGDRGRFRGRRVLELGCHSGRMSCWFGLQGATVLGLDVEVCDLGPARALARSLGVGDSVSFQTYDGNLLQLPAGEWDFVFTKSVLVQLRQPVGVMGIRRLLAAGGEYLGCENMELPLGLDRFRRWRTGITPIHVRLLRQHFRDVSVRRHWAIAAAIVARV